jgi:hypothetical protein
MANIERRLDRLEQMAGRDDGDCCFVLTLREGEEMPPHCPKCGQAWDSSLYHLVVQPLGSGSGRIQLRQASPAERS